jgi:hypothetical protein
MAKALLDKGLEKMVSRKLIVFLIATTFFLMGNVEADMWFQLAMVYVGTQGAVDIVTKLRNSA